jgi:hypothetical protein
VNNVRHEGEEQHWSKRRSSGGCWRSWACCWVNKADDPMMSTLRTFGQLEKVQESAWAQGNVCRETLPKERGALQEWIIAHGIGP